MNSVTKIINATMVRSLTKEELMRLQDISSKFGKYRDSEVFCLQCSRYTIYGVCACTDYKTVD